MQKTLIALLVTLVAYLFLDEGQTLSSTNVTTLPPSTPTIVSPAQTAPRPGTESNALILALAPSPRPTVEMIAAGEALAAQLEELSGYQIVTVIPATETDIVKAFDIHNAHIAVLSPFAYLQTRQDGTTQAALASIRNEEAFYGSQFIARSDAGFQPYFDPTHKENTAEATEALAQFMDKKACWSDTTSSSAYVVPLGYLNQAQVQTRPPAFLEGQGPVVRAVHADGICDFGATYIDARLLPTLESDYPDVMEKVDVIWRTPPIIPYEIISFAASLPPEMHRALQRAFIDLMNTNEGKVNIQVIYSVETLQPTEDNRYNDFATYVEASGLELESLLK